MTLAHFWAFSWNDSVKQLQNCHEGMVQFVDVHCSLNTPFPVSTFVHFWHNPLSPPVWTSFMDDPIVCTQQCGLLSKFSDLLLFSCLLYHRYMYIYTHTHPFNGCLGLPGWAGTRKAKPIWILLKQETVRGSGIRWAICKSAPRCRQKPRQHPTAQFFTGRMPFLPPSQQHQSTEGTFSTWDVVTTSPTHSSAFIGSVCRSKLYSRWRRWRIVHCMVLHHLTRCRHSHMSPTCHTDAGSGPPPLSSLTFRPVVGQLSAVVPFLLLEQRCGMACQAKLRRPRRCQCLRTGWRHTCSAAVTKLFDFQLHSPFLVIISHPRTVALAIVFTV